MEIKKRKIDKIKQFCKKRDPNQQVNMIQTIMNDVETHPHHYPERIKKIFEKEVDHVIEYFAKLEIWRTRITSAMKEAIDVDSIESWFKKMEDLLREGRLFDSELGLCHEARMLIARHKQALKRRGENLFFLRNTLRQVKQGGDQTVRPLQLAINTYRTRYKF